MSCPGGEHGLSHRVCIDQKNSVVTSYLFSFLFIDPIKHHTLAAVVGTGIVIHENEMCYTC